MVMDNAEYKKRIASEYNRLFVDADPNLDHDPDYLHVFAWGNEGLEGYAVSQDYKDIAEKVNVMELRARFNSHRNIHVYGFLAGAIVAPECIDEELVKNPKVRKIS